MISSPHCFFCDSNFALLSKVLFHLLFFLRFIGENVFSDGVDYGTSSQFPLNGHRKCFFRSDFRSGTLSLISSGHYYKKNSDAYILTLYWEIPSFHRAIYVISSFRPLFKNQFIFIELISVSEFGFTL